MLAYNPQGHTYWGSTKLEGAPSWLSEELYDIDAKISPEDIPAWQSQGWDDKLLKLMLQDMLVDRCRIQIDSVYEEGSVYHLVLSKHGPNGMVPTTPGEVFPKRSIHFTGYDGVLNPIPGEGIRFSGTSMQSLAAFLTTSVDRPVLDATGIKGIYDFILPKESAESLIPGTENQQPESSYDISRLGLTLKPAKGPRLSLVIDHIEKPSAN